AKLAMVTGRPVKITLTREEVFYCHRGRHPTLMWVKTGVTKDGAITGMHFRSLLDGGGYGSYGVASTYYTGALQTVTYHVPRYKFQGARAFTNKPPCGPKRGHGTPQPRFALEVQLDKIAEQLGMDPAELRLQHLVPPNSLTANWLKIGNACNQAAERARDVIASHVARKLRVPVERVAFADRRVFDVEDPAHGLAFAEAVQAAEAAEGTIGTVGSYSPAPSPGKYRG